MLAVAVRQMPQVQESDPSSVHQSDPSFSNSAPVTTSEGECSFITLDKWSKDVAYARMRGFIEVSLQENQVEAKSETPMFA